MKQGKLNKILIGVLLVLAVFLMQQKLTEQKRVEYYICFEQRMSQSSSADPDQVRERCLEIGDED